MLLSTIETTGFFFLTSVICLGSFSEDHNSIFNPSIWDQATATYPQYWLEKCGDDEGDIPLFKEKSDEFKECFEKQVNISTFVEELTEHYEDNKIPIFAKKYCANVDAISNCMNKFVKSVEHCFEPERQEDLRTTAGAIKAALKFVCYRDGERVLIFLREEGIECYFEQSAELHRCVNDTRPEDLSNITAPGELGFLASLNYDDKLCSHARKVSDCLYNAMTPCSKRAPSLIVEALTKTILKETPCYKTSSASSHFISCYLLIFILVILQWHTDFVCS